MEVPQAPVVTDYSDAIVVPLKVVEDRNARILELGKEKIAILHTTKVKQLTHVGFLFFNLGGGARFKILEERRLGRVRGEKTANWRERIEKKC